MLALGLVVVVATVYIYPFLNNVKTKRIGAPALQIWLQGKWVLPSLHTPEGTIPPNEARL